MIKDIIDDGISYAWRGIWRKLIKLGIFNLLSILFVPALIVTGYMTRVIKESPTSKEPPEIKNYRNLMVWGLKVLAVTLAYLIFPGMLLWTSIALFSYSPSLSIPLLLASLLSLLIALMFLGIGVAHMVETEKIRSAFSIRYILEIIVHIGWFRYIAFILFVLFVGLLISIIGVIPIVGWALAQFLLFPGYMIFYSRCTASLYKRGVRRAS